MEVEKQIVSDNNWHYFINGNNNSNFNKQISQILNDQAKNEISKVSFFIPKMFESDCNKLNLVKEAEIKGFFNGILPLVCYSSFQKKENSIISIPEKNVIAKIVNSSKKSTFKIGQIKTDQRFKINQIDKNNFDLINDLLVRIYPDETIREKIKNQILQDVSLKEIFGLFYYKQLVLIGSIRVSSKTSSGSIQDLYFDKNFKSNNYLFLIIDKLVTSLIDSNIKTVYSFTRALDPDINRVFGMYGFNHAGILVNETESNGNIENVNVWFKNLKQLNKI